VILSENPETLPSRAGTPADLRDAYLYLASEGASYVTGETVGRRRIESVGRDHAVTEGRHLTADENLARRLLQPNPFEPFYSDDRQSSQY